MNIKKNAGISGKTKEFSIHTPDPLNEPLNIRNEQNLSVDQIKKAHKSQDEGLIKSAYDNRMSDSASSHRES